MIFLSYVLNQNTPTYGNRNRFEIIKKNAIAKGDIANDSFIATTAHAGTHIDMPYHFYEEGQTIEDFDNEFWIFKQPLIIEIAQEELIIKDTLISRLEGIEDIEYDILIVKTGIGTVRNKDKFWKHNYGFHPDIYNVLVTKFPFIRVLGFDSISVSSFQNRSLGRQAHQVFLNPQKPILLLEDMMLSGISEKTKLEKIIIAPLRVSKCDGLPCTVMGFIND